MAGIGAWRTTCSATPPGTIRPIARPDAKAILEPYVAAADDAFVWATKAAGFVATGLVILGVIFSLLLPTVKPHPVRVEGLSGGGVPAPDPEPPTA